MGSSHQLVVENWRRFLKEDPSQKTANNLPSYGWTQNQDFSNRSAKKWLAVSREYWRAATRNKTGDFDEWNKKYGKDFALAIRRRGPIDAHMSLAGVQVRTLKQRMLYAFKMHRWLKRLLNDPKGMWQSSKRNPGMSDWQIWRVMAGRHKTFKYGKDNGTWQARNDAVNIFLTYQDNRSIDYGSPEKQRLAMGYEYYPGESEDFATGSKENKEDYTGAPEPSFGKEVDDQVREYVNTIIGWMPDWAKQMYKNLTDAFVWQSFVAVYNSTLGFLLPELPRDSSKEQLIASIKSLLVFLAFFLIGGPIVKAAFKILKILFIALKASKVLLAFAAAFGVAAAINLIISAATAVCEKWKAEWQYAKNKGETLPNFSPEEFTDQTIEELKSRAEAMATESGYVKCLDEEGEMTFSHPEDCADNSKQANNESLIKLIKNQTEMVLENYKEGFSYDLQNSSRRIITI